ncbi:hypothetical protein ACFFRR_005522 [Megaselia abdita]
MGKAQSKRSVDITTEVVVEGGTGRVEKIEDVDQLKPEPQSNGDPQHNDVDHINKEENIHNGSEHEKDFNTEKENLQSDAVIDEKSNNPDENASGDLDAKKTIQNEEVNENKCTEATAASTPDSSKKTKKDKLKKKWSFRSISFGKKDKQKPLKKTEEKTQVASATDNGESDKVPDENVIGDKMPAENAVNLKTSIEISDEKKPDEDPVINGDCKDITAIPENVLFEEKKDLEINSTVNGSDKEETEKPSEQSSLPADSIIENPDECKLNGSGIENKSPEIEVIEFALNDKKEDQQETKTAPTDLNVTPLLLIPSVIETAPTPEIEKTNDITPDIVSDITEPISEQKPIINIDQTVSVSFDKENELISETEELTSELISTEDMALEKVEIVTESQEGFEIKIDNCKNIQEQETQDLSSHKEHGHVAKTLVEEITKSAVAIVEKQLSNNDQLSSDLEDETSELNGTHDHGLDVNIQNTIPPVTPEFTTTTITDENSTLKENGIGHEEETSMKVIIQNGGSEVIKTVEDKSESEMKINTSAEDSAVAVAD